MEPRDTIFIVRHPQTEWNAQEILQGHLDSPLTEKGRRDANDLGLRLAREGIKEVYASDLGRCIETAEIIRRHLGVVPVHSMAELRERNFGILNGRTNVEVVSNIDLTDPAAQPPGGETLTEMAERVEDAVGKLLKLQAGPLLVVTHEGPFHALEKSGLRDKLRFIK